MSQNFTSQEWWKQATGYQIWPASFKDSNNDGFGDIPGVTSKLDYLLDLGIDLIWLSPVYDSPQADFGYDVSNYETIYAKYGTLADMDVLISAARQRGIRVIMDLVINHTSDQHEWFIESRKSRTGPFADFYHWRDPKYDEEGKRGPPNNWLSGSQFGGSTWEYAAERDQYYFHLSATEQPDLNWENPVMRETVYASAVDFWLKRGIDGFRIDVVGFYWKDTTFPDVKVTIPGQFLQPLEGRYCHNGAKVHVWLKEMRRKMTESYGKDVVLIGELPNTSREETLKFVSPQSQELNMSLDLDVFQVGNDWNSRLHERKKPALPLVKDMILKAQSLLEAGGWTTAFLESHDYGRSVSRFGPGEGQYQAAAAKMLALLVTTLSGTLFVYQGEEFGMTNFPPHWTAADLRDPADVRHLQEFARAGDQEMGQIWLEAVRKWGRDNCRTPTQWDATEYAGFSAVQPWIRVNDNYLNINGSEQAGRPASVLNFWKDMIRLRKQHADTLICGRFELLDRDDTEVFSYRKTSALTAAQVLVVLNFSDGESEPRLLRELEAKKLRLVKGTHGDPLGDGKSLRPWEGRFYSLE